ncbi:hypothetical protein F442_05998, partial [Phytophthora nicotianae P10297]
MSDDAPESPVNPKPTDEMKPNLLTKLEDTPPIVPQLFFAFLCREVQQNRMCGPTPELKHAQNF